MKFLVDMPLSPGMASWLAELGHDATHASTLGLSSAGDATLMELARREGRVMITADLDYPRLLALTEAAGPGLILFRGGNYSEQDAIDRMARMFESVPIDQISSSVVVIEKGRIRRRRLPLTLSPD
jgi:predicted nuclease of predicted toxin-antitoxin system